MNYDLMETPLGQLALAVDDDGNLREVGFTSDNAPYGRHVSLGAEWKRVKNPRGMSAKLRAYFDGDLSVLDELPVKLDGTPFELKVWNALRTIPCGETWSYAQLARAIGQPTATRAVGLANGRNPIAIVVPCHRVIGANGKLTGYGGGLHRKRWLLNHEFVVAFSGHAPAPAGDSSLAAEGEGSDVAPPLPPPSAAPVADAPRLSMRHLGVGEGPGCRTR